MTTVTLPMYTSHSQNPFSHLTTLLSYAKKCITNSSNTDLTFRTKDKSFPSFLCLMSQCPLIATLIQSVPLHMQDSPNILLPQFSSTSVNSLLSILYTGQCSLSQSGEMEELEKIIAAVGLKVEISDLEILKRRDLITDTAGGDVYIKIELKQEPDMDDVVMNCVEQQSSEDCHIANVDEDAGLILDDSSLLTAVSPLSNCSKLPVPGVAHGSGMVTRMATRRACVGQPQISSSLQTSISKSGLEAVGEGRGLQKGNSIKRVSEKVKKLGRGRGSRKKRNIIMHRKSVCEGGKFQCDNCDYHATLKINLVRRQQTIHEGRLFKCELCPKMYRWQADLFMHKHTVHEGKRYPCDKCDYQARRRGFLAIHKRSVHTGLKYQCGSCDHQASTAAILTRHCQSIHEGKLYPCDNCDYQATQRGNLNRHHKRVHGRENK